jgi:CARDB
VREAALWVSGAALAFFVTAGAFLLLANLGSGPSEKSLAPDPRPAQSGSALELSLEEDHLASLEALPGQRLDVAVENTGDDDLAQVNLTLEVSSENTALSDVRYYRQTVNKLAAGESVSVPFYLDLSAQEDTNLAAVPEPPRKIVEVRATAPAGVSAIKTAILPLQAFP